MKQRLVFLATAMLFFSFTAMSEPPIEDEPTIIDNVYQIATWQDLLWISQNPTHWDKDYVQTNDIDFATADPAINTWNEGKGWSPIGQFTGSYDGGGYTIKNLYIDRPSEDGIGLFAFVIEASIENIRLVDANIKGYEFVGGIVGVSIFSQISNCFVSGNIQGDAGIGGIIGIIVGGVINESHNTANIVGREVAGGLAGGYQAGHVVNSYNSGDITGHNFLGGLVGALTGSKSGADEHITNSFSTAAFHLTGAPETKRTKKRSHPIISGFDFGDLHSKTTPMVGGIVGYDGHGFAITNSFFDYEVATSLGAVIEMDNLGAIGKTTEEMMNPETYASWGADIIADENIEKGYPILAWQYDASGRKNDPFWIIGTGTGNGEPVAVPLSDTALYLGLLLIGGFLVFRTYRS